jgi:acetyl-CoA synthetase
MPSAAPLAIDRLGRRVADIRRAREGSEEKVMATEPKASINEELDNELAELLEVERFDPPAEFREHALLNDPEVYERAERDPLAWWSEQARQLDWFTPWDTVLDDSDPPFYKWFTGGQLNVSYNCLDRHVAAGRGERVALHWRGEDGEERDITYAQLLRDVQRFANALKDQGVRKGDVVGIYLPMIPEVVVAMLACARIGAPHNVVFGGFSAEAVRERMEFSQAKLLITVDGAARKGKTTAVKDRVDEVMGDLHSLERIVVVRRGWRAEGEPGPSSSDYKGWRAEGEPGPSSSDYKGVPCEMQAGRDVFYDEIVAAAAPECPAEPLDAEHPLYILYTSGSTAKPKGILHTTGGYLTGVSATHRYVFDLKPDTDVYWCAADVGWVTGHSYIVYGPLANGATSVMWEGAPDYPHKGIWWELVERYGVTILYCAPTAIRACIKWGAQWPRAHDLSSLRLLGSVGEPINPKAWLWYHKVIGGERCPIVDTWWQTETGAIMITPLPGITATKPGSATQPFPGVQAKVLAESSGAGEDEREEIDEGQGLLVLTRPWPSMLRTLYKEHERFTETYFARFGKETYLVGDAARRDRDGYFWVIGRIDDVVNVSGHRLSTAEVESAIVAHPDVAEAAVIGQHDEDTGQAIVAFVTLQGDLQGDERTEEGIRATVAQRIGKFARPKRIIWTDDLPKTRSGKIMRRLLRDIAEGRALGDVTTLRDPEVMGQLEQRIKELQAQED